MDHSESFDAYVLITRLCYFMEGGDCNYQTKVELPGLLSEIVFAGYLEFKSDSFNNWRDDKHIKGANAQFKVYKDLGKFARKERIDGQDKD